MGPTEGAIHARTGETSTSSALWNHSDNVKPGTGGGNDVTVGLLLGQLYSLLLFQYQETVELCSCLFSVCISAQLKQTDRFCSSLSKSSLKNTTLISQIKQRTTQKQQCLLARFCFLSTPGHWGIQKDGNITTCTWKFLYGSQLNET